MMGKPTPLASRYPVSVPLQPLSEYEVPVHFGDAAAEYAAARSGAIVTDISPAGKVEVAGPEAPQFLHNLSTADIQSMPLGAGCEAFFCNARARALVYGRIYHLRIAGRDAMWIDVTPGYDVQLLHHLDRHLIAEQVELVNRTHQFGQIHVAGPQALQVLSRAAECELPNLDLHQHMERSIGSATVHIRRHDPLGIPGYDVVMLNDRAAAVWDRLREFGAAPAGALASDWLRIEAGTPIYGRDIDENRFVQEVGRNDAVSFTKGCFLGQEPIVMARDRAGFLSRYFRGVRSPAEMAVGMKLYAGEDDVGVLTSACHSPRMGPLGLAYIRRGFESAGTALQLGDSSRAPATVSPLPFTD